MADTDVDVQGGPTLTDHEVAEVHQANESGLRPVVFVHGLWLLSSSWDRWRRVFERAGYSTLAPGWPGDPETTAEAKRNPELFAQKSVGQVADHYEEVIGRLARPPALIGHSFGGLLAEILAGRGLAAASVAISPAPFRGILSLRFSALRSASPVLRNPANRNRAVPLTFRQFRYSFANMVDEDEALELYEKFAVPGSGTPLFQAGAANLNPWTEVKVDTRSPDRGPMLILAAEKDHTVPHAVAKSSFRHERKNRAETEIVAVPDRGHSLTIDSGWREVCDKALSFIQHYA